MLTAADQAIRATGIGSSEIASVVGLSEYDDRGPHHVWLLKLGLAEVEPSEAMELGHAFEPVIAKLYEKRTGRLVRPGPGTIRHRTHPWAVASIDYEADDGGITECKLVGQRSAWRWDLTQADGVPADVLCQVQWQMEVLDRDIAHVAVVFGGLLQVAAFEIKRDRGFAGMLMERAERFWTDHVLTKTPPPTDDSNACRRALAEYYPAREPLIDAPDGAYELIKKRGDAAARVQAAEAEKILAENQIRELIGRHDCGGIRDPRRGGWGYVTWKADRNGRRTLRFNLTAEEKRKAS